MPRRLLLVRHIGQTISKRPEGNRPLFDPSLAGKVDDDPAQRYLGLAIGGVMLLVVGMVVFVAWTLRYTG